MHALEAGGEHGDRAAAPQRVARAADLEAGLVEQTDEQLGLANGIGADPLDADLLDQVIAGRGGVERGHVRRSGQEARGAPGERHLRGERERALVRLPAGERRLEPVGEVGPYVQPACARPAAQPLDASADGEVDLERGHVQRDGACRLVGVEDDVRAGLVRAPHDRLDVLDLGRLEEDVADGNEQGPLVDRLDQRFFVGDDDNLRPALGLRLVDVAHRGEVALLEDYLVARRLEPEAGEDDRLGDGHVLVHDRRAGRRTDDAADLVADGDRHRPPALAPGADPARRPDPRVLGDAVGGRGRHRAERVVDQIRRLGEDREALAVGGQLHGAEYRVAP